MTMAPLISVLMPCYNSEQYLEEAILSIINQSYDNWELLICNDASTDNSLKILQKYKSDKIKIFENKYNLGYLKTCNFLFSKAIGDYITFQDSDDYSDIKRLQLLLNKFIENPQLGACGTQFNFMTDEGVKLPEDSPVYPTHHQEIVKTFSESPGFNGASVMVKKEVIETVGTYNEYWDRIGAEDHYWLFLIAEKYQVANLEETLYYYRHNPNSVTRNKTNPRKIHCHDFLMHFFQQRKSSGTDDIETNNIGSIEKMEKTFVNIYEKDPTYIFTRLIDWSYTDQDFTSVFKYIFSALKVKPLSLYWYKTLFYYFKKIYL